MKCRIDFALFAAVLVIGGGCGSNQSTPAPAGENNQPGPNAQVVKAQKPVVPVPVKGLRPAAAALGANDWDRGPFSFPSVQDWSLKETAADALARIGESAVPSLAQALAAPEVSVRLNAARALARIGPEAKSAVPALVTALNDADPLVRITAARALGQIGADASSAIPALIRAMESEK